MLFFSHLIAHCCPLWIKCRILRIPWLLYVTVTNHINAIGLIKLWLLLFPSLYILHCCLCRFLPVLKSSWFIGCFAETTNDETDLATHLSLVCNALSLLPAVVQSADVLQQLCPSTSCKIATFLELGDYLFSSNNKKQVTCPEWWCHFSGTTRMDAVMGSTAWRGVSPHDCRIILHFVRKL